MDKSRFGSFINQLRKEKGITQKELAEILHVTDKAVSRWETGRSYPDIEVMQRIAEYFDVSVNELLRGERIPEESIKTITDKNVVNAFKRIKKNKNRYEAIVAILVAVIVILGCLWIPRIGALLDGAKSTKLDVTSNDAVAILSCIDGYITAETGAPAKVDEFHMDINADKTVINMHVGGATAEGTTFFCGAVKDLEVFPYVQIYRDKYSAEVNTTMTTKDLVKLMSAIDLRELDKDFSPDGYYYISADEDKYYTSYVQDEYDDNKTYMFDSESKRLVEVPKGELVEASFVYIDIFKCDEYGNGESIVHILWLM